MQRLGRLELLFRLSNNFRHCVRPLKEFEDLRFQLGGFLFQGLDLFAYGSILLVRLDLEEARLLLLNML